MPPDSSGRKQTVFSFDDFRLDGALRSLYRGDQRLLLSPRPLATLEFLIENRHRVVSKAELLEKVWGGQREVSTVEHAVGQIRRVLGDDAGKPRYVETIAGQGYRFIGVLKEEAGMGKAARPAARRRWIAAAAVVLLLAGFAAMRLLRTHARVAQVEVHGTALVARGVTGDVLWTHEFDAPLVEAPAGTPAPQTQIADLDGDGFPEILLTATFPDTPRGPEALLCFSSAGKLLWRYKPVFDGGFHARDLSGPWRFLDVLAIPGKPLGAIWAAVVHDIWWPSFIVRLSAAGTAERMFTNSGDIYKLQRIQNQNGSYIAAAGVNNEYRQASLAILSESAPPSTSPQTPGSEYECIHGCPSARPYRYILLPRSELNTASEIPYNTATSLRLRPGGFTLESDEKVRGVAAFYDFSRDFQPERVSYSDGYREVHQRFEKEGRIHHSFANCPERKTPAVLRICDQNGNWSEVGIPRAPLDE
jgi:DNA-binding winged helix-turn-helix (wHTH) protein